MAPVNETRSLIHTWPVMATLACVWTFGAVANQTGLLLDVATKQEQDDALQVITWLAAQPWCTGAVGMMGISWGGIGLPSGRGSTPAGFEGDRNDLLHG